MNGARAKVLRKLSNHSLKRWRRLGPDRKFAIEKHTVKKKKVVRDAVRGTDKTIMVDTISLQLWTRGSMRLYRHYKRAWKNLNHKARGRIGV